MVAGGAGAAVTRIRAEVVRSRKVSARVGDIVAIPGGDGNVHAACIVARNSFGVAYGLFHGAATLFALSSDDPPRPVQWPVYSSDRAVKSGRWKIIGHDPRLCSLFPGEPEIFHRPKPGAPFGRGETARGKLRDLTREEAEKLGLLSGRYRQTYTCEFLEKQLPDLIARLAE
jgi:hypothetical protein